MSRHAHGPQLQCECEHRDHFPQRSTLHPDTVSHGPAGHAYGVEFPARHIEAVRTPFGTFAACPACRETCLADYAVEGSSSTTAQVVSPSDIMRLKP